MTQVDEAFFYFIAAIVLAAYIVAGQFVIKEMPLRTKHLHPLVSVILRSFLLATTFGVGFFATGSENGFGFPAPLLIAALTTNPGLIIFSAIAPFFLWWFFSF